MCVTVRERSTKTRPSSVSGFQPRVPVASLPAKRKVNVNGSLLYFYSICLDIRRILLNSILLTHHAYYSITHFHSFVFLLEREREYFLSRYMRDVSFMLSGCFFRVLYLVRDQSKNAPLLFQLTNPTFSLRQQVSALFCYFFFHFLFFPLLFAEWLPDHLFFFFFRGVRTTKKD